MRIIPNKFVIVFTTQFSAEHSYAAH